MSEAKNLVQFCDCCTVGRCTCDARNMGTVVRHARYQMSLTQTKLSTTDWSVPKSCGQHFLCERCNSSDKVPGFSCLKLHSAVLCCCLKAVDCLLRECSSCSATVWTRSQAIAKRSIGDIAKLRFYFMGLMCDIVVGLQCPFKLTSNTLFWASHK